MFSPLEGVKCFGVVKMIETAESRIRNLVCKGISANRVLGNPYMTTPFAENNPRIELNFGQVKAVYFQKNIS